LHPFIHGDVGCNQSLDCSSKFKHYVVPHDGGGWKSSSVLTGIMGPSG
jgi:hypothetical protein